MGVELMGSASFRKGMFGLPAFISINQSPHDLGGVSCQLKKTGLSQVARRPFSEKSDKIEGIW